MANEVILVGRLGLDPELKHTKGDDVCELRLATNESWTDKSGKRQERTEWHRIVVWGKLGELCAKYLKKGRECYVRGSLKTRSWDDKDGKKQYATEVVARNVEFLGDKPKEGENRSERGRGRDEDSPF